MMVSGARPSFIVIPGRAGGADPESILRSAGVMDSGFARLRPSGFGGRPGMTGEM